jgi:hypothetical protein
MAGSARKTVMAKRPVNPNHRRIYVATRIKQIRTELKDLKAKLATKPKSKATAAETDKDAHREFIFGRIRYQELRKELAELRAETSGKSKAAKTGDLGDF